MARITSRQPDRERFEVRRVLPAANGWRRRERVSWHRKEACAIAAAKRLSGEVQVVWTHSDDKQLSGWLDDAMVVWSNRYEDEEDGSGQ